MPVINSTLAFLGIVILVGSSTFVAIIKSPASSKDKVLLVLASTIIALLPSIAGLPVISLPLTSKLPPSWGVVSKEIAKAVVEVWLEALPINILPLLRFGVAFDLNAPWTSIIFGETTLPIFWIKLPSPVGAVLVKHQDH